MKAMIHKLSKVQKSVIASVLALVMVFSAFAFIAPKEAQAISVDATDTGFYNLAYGANGETTFGVGSQIRIINQTRLGESKSDAVYKYDGMKWEPVDNSYVVWDGTANNTFYGVYPHTAEYDSFTIPTDQSGGVKVADWMTDSHTGSKSAGRVQFTFQHLLSKVTVNITKWNTEFNGTEHITEPKLYSKGTNVTATYGNTAATVTSTGEITAIVPEISGTSYTAIVAPAKYAITDKFMTFTVDSQQMTVLVNDNTVLTNGLESGNHYTFNLSVGKNAVEITEVTVNGWTEETISAGTAKECEHNFVNAICTVCGTKAYTYDSSVNTYYVYYGAGLQPAVTEASASGTADSPATVKLMNDMTVGNNGSGANGQKASVILSSGVVVLDLNDCVLTTTSDYASVDIANNAKLTIIDSSFDKGGTITGSNPVILHNLGKLTVENGNFINTSSNSIRTCHVIYSYKFPNSTNEISVIINGGTFISPDMAVTVLSNTSLTINGGLFQANNYAISIMTAAAKITGGTFNGGTYDIQSETSNILSFDEVTGNGPSFPGGIAVHLQYFDSKSLSELLATGAAYYNADGEMITLEAGATNIDGDVTVKKAD